MSSKKGSYTLIIKIPEDKVVEVGRLGSLEFPAGFYAYNGSAFGPGGLKRVERHKEKSSEKDSAHWHIDYLLIQKEADIIKVFKTEKNHECSLSRKMMRELDPMKGFGCSDCDCVSHLFYSRERREITGFLKDFYPNQGKF